jgi:hypothetical protein
MPLIARTTLIIGLLFMGVAGVSHAQTKPKLKKPRPQRTLYGTYVNARFGYTISYPTAYLRPEAESDNGDGRRFTSNDGTALLTVWGENRMEKESVASIYRAQLDQAGVGRVVTYKVLKPTWFVISWREGGRIYYRKTIARKDGFASFILEYAEKRKDVFDPMVRTISDGFK